MLARGKKVESCRRRGRFDLVLPLQFRLSSGQRGNGETISVGHDSLLLLCQEPLPLAEIIVIDIAWPVLAGGRDRLVLHVEGVIERIDGNSYEVSLGKHTFLRTVTPRGTVLRNTGIILQTDSETSSK